LPVYLESMTVAGSTVTFLTRDAQLLEIGAIPDSISCICTKHFLWHQAKDSSLSTRCVLTKASIPPKILDGVRELR
jgi:hypothetical protein